MNDLLTPPKYNVDLPHTRISTLEEILEIMNDPVRLAELDEKNKTSEISICSQTFQPYKVIDGVRYDIEVLMDVKARGF